MSIDVQNATARCQIERRFIRSIREPFVSIPDDRALAGTRIDDDESDLILSAFDRFRKIRVDVFIAQRLQTELAVFIQTEPAHIRRLQSEPLQSHHRRRCLATGGFLILSEASLCVERRIFGHNNQMIDSVQAKAYRIKVAFTGNL